MAYLKLFMCIGNHVCVLLQFEYLQAERLVLPGVGTGAGVGATETGANKRQKGL